jgi:hypothetical protein
MIGPGHQDQALASLRRIREITAQLLLTEGEDVLVGRPLNDRQYRAVSSIALHTNTVIAYLERLEQERAVPRAEGPLFPPPGWHRRLPSSRCSADYTPLARCLQLGSNLAPTWLYAHVRTRHHAGWARSFR